LISVSALTIVEISSTLARRVREGTLTARERDGVLRRFRRHLRDFTVVETNLDVLNEAGTLVVHSPLTIPLRSLDAIHLASAQSLTAMSAFNSLDPLTFVSPDTRLLAAAQWAGFEADNPENHP
jgi:predicted nucleic acid-binding protein